MKVLETIFDLQKELSVLRTDHKTIGFVPTMGALHEGHIALVTKSREENDVSVVSIFVNPTQFNNIDDLDKYPRTVDEDIEKLKLAKVDFVFLPTIEEIYPKPDIRQFKFGHLDKVMEGKFRPGHFNGVAQVVSKLFDIVKPNRAYFGEKDFQQLAIIRDMVKQYSIPVEIIPVSIVREVEGLAMSSRNQRLTDNQRKTATNIYRILSQSKKQFTKQSITETIDIVVNQINAINELEVEYFDIVDGDTLQAVLDWNESCYIVGCIVVYCGEVRLIDNIVYRPI